MLDPIPMAMFIALVLLILWSAILTFFYLRLVAFFKVFTMGITKRDLKSLLELINHKLDHHQEKLTTLEETAQSSRLKQKTHLQKSALVRYNPFGDTGGNQSFALSLLDAEGNGFVVTSLHSREHTRVYAKEVRGGSQDKTEYSKEEQEAIASALKKGSR